MQGSAADPGVVPAAVRDIFTTMAGVPDRQFLLRLSMLEIYNEVRSVAAFGVYSSARLCFPEPVCLAPCKAWSAAHHETFIRTQPIFVIVTRNAMIRMACSM